MLRRFRLLKNNSIQIKAPQSKKVYCYLNGKVVGEYDSKTKCANALGMSRAMVSRAIDQKTVLENGFVLSLT